MSDTKTRHYTVDTRLEAHASFFDHQWAKDVSEFAKNSPLDNAIFNLIEGWKGAANTARLPWMTIKFFGTFAETFTNSPSEKEARLASAAAAYLGKAILPPLSEAQWRSLSGASNKLQSDIAEKLGANPFTFDAEKCWQDMMGMSEFTLSIVASQRLAFAAVYYAYEDFLLTCFMLTRGISEYRIGRSFSADLAATYSPTISQDVWIDREVSLARLVRHAIVHNGCRETKDLKKFGHHIPVVDGFLQITAPFVRAEFNSLKGKASLLLRETIARATKPTSPVTSSP